MNRLVILITVLLTVVAGCQKASDPAKLSTGKAIFDEHCAVCHGPGGDVRLADQHNPKTPDLRTIAKHSPGGRIPRVMLVEVVDGRRILQAHGSRTMPVWGDLLDSDDGTVVEAKIDALMDYVKSIQIE